MNGGTSSVSGLCILVFVGVGCWEIKSLDHRNGQELVEVFNFVLVTVGHHGNPNIPNFTGLDRFKGEVIHSKEFKHALGFVDKRVCVVGIGNSGGDIAAELSKYSQVFLSTRRGVWIRQRLSVAGMPWDYTFHSRFRLWLHNLIPRKLSNYILKKQLNHKVDHDLYCLKPQNEPDATHPTVNDELPNRIACGMVRVKSNIRRFTETGKWLANCVALEL
ncbi:dimethylaniline monooxygenase [N-oxide-forming] [Elysia marginata]|uniref:Flavin-containing monooxygenase n=1 Tax=Elysia marginata TaxID=1093978 RepID=A0AAV4K3S8_9GAST|nr:dimethylaniline monooxygenase [N-oxide-forming] [Elysia marginata]